MTSLVSPADVRALVKNDLTDLQLQGVIDRIEAQVTERIGAPQDDSMSTTITKTFRGEHYYLYMPTEIHEVVSIVEDSATLTGDEYQTWAGGVIERLPSESYWGDRIVVTYKPKDDRKVRSQVIIDLARIVIERTAMKGESIGGEYSYTAPENWDVQFNQAMKRLLFKAL